MEMINHKDVLRALKQALKKTEEAFDLTVDENPELALMGSCVLVTLMKGEDVYVMSVGDSRAVLAQRPDLVINEKLIIFLFVMQQEVRRINKEHPDDPFAIKNDRVKGYLKVTRAFGAGFLKQV
ncbi:unnamed protein product, partial [Brassica rapa subsp. trilocularis]